MKKFYDIITHNFGWKIVSLLTAVMTWFLVVNITNPTTERSIPATLRVDGVEALRENNTILLNADELESTFINLWVRGSVSTLAQLRKENTLTAYINLTPIDIALSSELGKRLPVRVKYDQNTTNYDILYSVPDEVDVVLDKYVTRNIPVLVEKTDEDKEGYISLDPVVTPVSVAVSGPLSVVNSIAELKATVEVGEATEDFELMRPISITNADGKDISDKLSVNVDEVSIKVVVETYARIPVSTPVTVGTVAEGYRVTAVEVKPREIEVEGNSANIRALKAIRLMDVDVTGISRTKVETYDMRAYLQNSGLSVREGSEGRVQVTVTVEREITKEILVPVDTVEIRGMTSGVSLPSGEIQLEVRGIASEIVEFEETELVTYIDVTDLEPGTHELEVHLVTPEGIVQTGTEAIEVIIDNGESAEEADIEDE